MNISETIARAKDRVIEIAEEIDQLPYPPETVRDDRVWSNILDELNSALMNLELERDKELDENPDNG